jgi:hypothetical protein
MQGLLLFIALASSLIANGSTDKALLTDYIAAQATLSGVPVQMALHIANAESQLNKEAVGDHGTSFGIFQIHNPQSKGLTVEQAKDILISTEWTMNTIKKDGGCRQWSTCSSGG